jgi:uncharacterized protein YbjT (DUF2867 family)
MDVTARQPVLITGASGFIGGRLVRRLIERQSQVSCLVRADSRVDELRSGGVTTSRVSTQAASRQLRLLAWIAPVRRS